MSSKLSITETTESRAVLNICEYVFSVSSIFVCHKYLATNVILAPLFIKSDAHECLKSWILITFKPARVASLVLLRYILESAIGLASETTKKSEINKMDKLDFIEGIKILSSCYQKVISNDDISVWYEILQDIEPEVFKKLS